MSQNNNKKTLIIDCDPGCDDALALLLAIRKGGYQKIIMTTVAGNVPVVRTTFNAQKIAALAAHGLNNAQQIEIYRGSAISLMGTAPNVMSVHGRDGLGDVPDKLYPESIRNYPKIQDKGAVEFYLSLSKESDKKQYDLVCTGPLTNLANAISLANDPKKLINKFSKIVVMGGAFYHSGNITPTAEFNFFFDPIAVQIVLDAFREDSKNNNGEDNAKIIFVPLNVTEKVQLSWDEIKELDFSNSDIGKWTLCMLQKYFRFHAFGGPAILKDMCANNTCSDENLSCCQFKEESEYEQIRESILKERKKGKSGLNDLPRFSYLHDPLAVYCAVFNNMNNAFKEEYISVHTGKDEMRGTVIIHNSEKRSLSSRKTYTKGTKVSYLSPDELSVAAIAEFKKVLLQACDLV